MAAYAFRAGADGAADAEKPAEAAAVAVAVAGADVAGCSPWPSSFSSLETGTGFPMTESTSDCTTSMPRMMMMRLPETGLHVYFVMRTTEFFFTFMLSTSSFSCVASIADGCLYEPSEICTLCCCVCVVG